MANPQRENGHIDIANELATQFAKTRISGREWQVIWAVLRKTWGWLENPKKKDGKKKKMDWISQSQLSEMTGIPRRTIWNLCKALIGKNILIKSIAQKGDSIIVKLGFQKDFDKWKLSPKKAPVAQNGDGVSPKTATQLSPKTAHTKDIPKDTYTKDMILSQIKDLLSSFSSDIQILLEDFFALMAGENKTGVLTPGRKFNELNALYNVFVNADVKKFKEALEITVKQQVPNVNYIKAVLKGFEKKQRVFLSNKAEDDKNAADEANMRAKKEVQRTREMLDKITT